MNQKMKDLFFDNLLLLGFDKSNYDKHGLYDNITCNKHMFSKPNPKMFEIVTHFLFSKLDGNYFLPWPLLEKSHIKEFQKLTFTYLSSIAKESQIKFPTFTPSVITTAGKDRFCELYFAFSCHVLQKCIEDKGNAELLHRPKAPSGDFKVMLQLETIASTERTQNLLRFSKEHMEQLVNCSSDFSSLISFLRSSYLTRKSDLGKKSHQFCSLYLENEVMNDASAVANAIKKHISYEKKVQKHWEALQKFLAKEQELWKQLSIEDVDYVLDSSLIDMPTLVVLVDEHGETKLKTEKTSREKRKPSLYRFLKLFAELLKSLLQIYLTGKSTNLHAYSKLENSWCLDESQKEMIALKNKIFRSLIDIKKSTEILQEEIFAGQCSAEMERFSREVQNWTFCSKSFLEKMNSERANICLPSKDGSFILTAYYTEPSTRNLSSTEDLEISEECSPPMSHSIMKPKKEVSNEDSHDLKSLESSDEDCDPTAELTFDFSAFGFHDPGRKSNHLDNMSLLDVSLPDDEDDDDDI